MTEEWRRKGGTLPKGGGRSGTELLAALAALVGWAILVRLAEPERPGPEVHPEIPNARGSKVIGRLAHEPRRGRESAAPKEIPRPG
jgi:hypothetical protein